MTTKFLIETLSEVPDMQLLVQLFDTIRKTDSLVIADVRKLFIMLSNLYMCKNSQIINKCFELNQHLNKKMLKTEVQISWQFIGKSLVRLCGQQNSQIRKRARNMILQIMSLTNNPHMILQKLYYEGLEDESIIVQIYSIKTIFRILQLNTNILSKQSYINIIKLILQKMIRLTNSQHTDLLKNAKVFLDRLFFLKIQQIDLVLQRLDSFYVKSLENLWEKNKDNLLFKQEDQQESNQAKSLKEIKYQHLPMIGDKFFAVYEPFIIKNLFNPETHAAKKYSISQFKQLFLINTERLTKYANSISKIILKLLPQKHYEILQLLAYMITIPGIPNIINLNELTFELISQLDTENVPYRRQLRDILKQFNYLENIKQGVVKKYQEVLENEGEEVLNWLKTYQILCLIEHWAQHADSLQCYPPTLNFAVKYISLNLKNKVIKVREQCEKLLYFILQKFTGYRQNLEEYFDLKMVGKFEDVLEKRRIQKLPEDQKVKESKQTFLKEFNEQRLRFLKAKNK